MPMPTGRAVFTAVAIVFAVVMFTQGLWWIIFPLMGVLGGCGSAGQCSTGRASRHDSWHTGERQRADGWRSGDELVRL
jgi:hypothetical protein